MTFCWKTWFCFQYENYMVCRGCYNGEKVKAESVVIKRNSDFVIVTVCSQEKYNLYGKFHNKNHFGLPFYA